MRTKTILIGSLMTAIFVSTSLLAEDAPSPDQKDPGQYTRDADLSKEERREMRKKFHQQRKSMREDRLEELDSNQDEKVDLAEYLANAEKRFNELDTDGDGYVTREEARSRHQELRQKHKEMRKKMLHENNRGEQEEPST